MKAAVAHGADAVYLGATAFSARAKAENFGEDTLKAWIDYAHLFGVKVYVTVNTLIKDEEMDEALDLVKKMREFNADAVIIQDIGLIERVRKCSDIILHASTQMGVHNLEGALIAKDLGLSRVVVSRETSIKDIEKISSVIETEVFVQGALCVAFSGNCYFSSIVSGYSGNRGKCLQLCRKTYDCLGKKDYRLSTSDMMLAYDLQRLKDAGVCSLKIEGRMRRPEYVAAAVDVYKNAIKSRPTAKDIDVLKAMYNRGDYNRAYYFEPTANVIFPSVQGHIGVPNGKIKRANKTMFVADKPIKAGNGYKILRNGKECGGALAIKDGFECGYTGSVMAGDEIRLTTDKQLCEQVLSKKRKIAVNAKIEFFERETILTLCAKGLMITARTEACPPAQKQPASDADIARLVKRCGDSDFEIENVDIYTDFPVFLVKSRINELRRNALELLSTSIVKNHEKSMQKFGGNYKILDEICDTFEVSGIVTMVSDCAVPNSIIEQSQYVVVNPTEYSLKNLETYRGKEKFVLNLPIISREDETDKIKEIVDSGIFDKFVVNNLYGIELTRGKKVLPGYGLNLINSQTKLTKINSFENDSLPSGAIPYIYAKAPLMTFCHCPKKVRGGNCAGCKGYDITLTDDKNQSYALRRYKIKYCYSQLLPLSPLYFGYKKRGFIDLSAEKSEQLEQIFDKIISGDLPLAEANFARGLK